MIDGDILQAKAAMRDRVRLDLKEMSRLGALNQINRAVGGAGIKDDELPMAIFLRLDRGRLEELAPGRIM